MLKSSNPTALLVAVALCLFLISHMVDLGRIHGELEKSLAAQKTTLEGSKKVEVQLDSLAKGVNALATGGNGNAQRIVAVLQQNGVSIKGR